MTFPISRFAFCAASLVLGTSASADVTARIVWDDMRKDIEIGYEITAEESVSDDRLTLNNMRIVSREEGDDVTQMSATIDTLELIENDDGSVSVIFPASIPFLIEGENELDQDFMVRFLVDQKGASLLVSGTPEELVYDYAAEEARVVLAEAVEGEETLSEEVLAFDVAMNNITGNNVSIPGATRRYQRAYSIDQITYSVGFSDQEAGGEGRIVGAIDDVQIENSGQRPEDLDIAEISSDMFGLFAGSGIVSYGGGQTEIDLASPDGQTVAIQTRSNGGAIDASLDDSGISYDVSYAQSNVLMSIPDLPFPVSFAIENSGLLVQLPLAESDEAQPFGFGFRLEGLEMSDGLWNIFDPGTLLPRDPSDLVVNLSGTAKVLIDVFEVARNEDVLEEPPVALETLDVNELLLSFAGATLSGDGAFSFETEDPVQVMGFPSPVGSLNLNLLGGNALLDNLVSLGFVQDDQAMGARMMMGLLAVPGTEPDSLSSTITITEQGHILANGQRIQ